MSKYIVVILTRSPFETNLAANSHNVILSTSAFFDEVKVIFSSLDAYYQLYHHHDTLKYGYKNILNSIKSFQWYDVENLYILEGVPNTNIDQSIPIISTQKAQKYILNSTHCFVY